MPRPTNEKKTYDIVKRFQGVFTTQDVVDAWGHSSAPTYRDVCKLVRTTGLAESLGRVSSGGGWRWRRIP